MLDPVSMINCIQFAFQCTELLGQGLKKTHKAIRKAKKIDKWMAIHRNNFRICLNYMEHWAIIWGFRRREPFDEATLQDFWGDGVFEDVQKHLESIAFLSQSIERRVSGSSLKDGLESALSEKLDWLEWRKQARISHEFHNIQPLTEELSSKYSMKLAKFLKALFDDNSISRDLTELKEVIERLTVVCRSTYNRDRGLDIDAPIILDNLVKTEDLRRQIHRFTSFASGLHERSSDAKCSWLLELRDPDEYSNAAEWRFLRMIHLDFALHEHSNKEPLEPNLDSGCKRIRLLYDPEIDHERQVDVIFGENSSIHRSKSSREYPAGQSSHLGECLRLSKPLRFLFLDKEMQSDRSIKAWKPNQARLLYGVVNWAILLFDTPWIQYACCSDIRFQKLSDHSVNFVIGRGFETYVPDKLVRGQKLLLLGNVLYEIMLCRPLDPSPGAKSNVPSLPRSPSIISSQNVTNYSANGSQTWGEPDIKRIRSEVRQAGYSVDVAEAVEYCFLHYDLADTDKRWPQIIIDLITKVLLPYKEYLQVVEEHRSFLNLTTWWNFFASSWPQESCYEPESGFCEGFQPRRILTQDMEKIPGAFPSSHNVRPSDVTI